MRSGIMIGVLVVIGAAISLLWVARDPGAAGPASGEVAERAPPSAEPPRRVGTPPVRERVGSTAAAEPGDAPPADESEAAAPAAEAADSQPTVPKLLERAIAQFHVESASSLRDVFGRFSGMTGVPVHVDMDSVLALDGHDGLALQIAGAAARDVLGMVSAVAGFEHTVLEDKVVLHPEGTEWTEGRPTVVIEPSPEPDASRDR